MGQNYSHFTYAQRIQMKEMLDSEIAVSEIAKRLGKGVSSVYREKQRGDCGNGYDPEYAENQYRISLQKKGNLAVIQQNPNLAVFISDCILKKNNSIEEVTRILKEDSRFPSVSKTTIYAAIDIGIVPNVSRDDLHSSIVKLNSEGFVYIPTWIREECGCKSNDIFSIELEDGRIVLTRRQ